MLGWRTKMGARNYIPISKFTYFSNHVTTEYNLDVDGLTIGLQSTLPTHLYVPNITFFLRFNNVTDNETEVHISYITGIVTSYDASSKHI